MNCRVHRLSLRVLSVWIASLILTTTAAGQTGAGVFIQVLEANAGQNLIAQETPPIKVRVMDRAGRAIPGANVLFAAPEGGPTGEFLPTGNQISIATDTQGLATSPRFRTNSAVGDYQIQVIASYKDTVSRVLIPQSNVMKRKSSSKKIFILSALVGGAAAAALAAKGGSSGPAASALGALAVTPTITLGGGQSSVGISTTFVPAPTEATTPIPPSGISSSLPTSPTGGSIVQPVPQPQPPVSSVCVGMPPTSNKAQCR